MESGEDGTVLLENLEDGRYVIRETEALQGYAKTEDTLTFTIDESYVVPEEMPCLVNKKEDEKHDIQTGVDIWARAKRRRAWHCCCLPELS